MASRSITTLALSKGWRFKQAGTSRWLKAQVPGCVHSDLRRNKRIPDPFQGNNEHELRWIEEADWTYRLEFKAGARLLNEDVIELVAEGLDTLATVMLNGETIATNDNMFVEHRIPVKAKLKAGMNCLEIHFHNPMDHIRKRQPELGPMTGDFVGGRQQIRKQQCSFGWDWGPRLATAGIYLPIRLEGWSVNRLEAYRLEQSHESDACTLRVADVETGRKGKRFRLRARLAFGKKVVAESEGALSETIALDVKQPKLWWPNGLGDQPLYEFSLELLDGETVVDAKAQRLGLCDIKLDRHKDDWGESFQFLVNGRPVFAKGANWIPSHSFVNEGLELIPDLLDSAADANMNMIRIWGGGVYEHESFYEGCLERGLMVWQDFMFACCLYPGDRAFLRSVEREAAHQVKRLRNYSHLALWCGNNEIEQLCTRQLRESKGLRRDYEKIFMQLLPGALERHAPGADYISSSEHNPYDPYGNTKNEDSGDVHFWGVWHSRQPIRSYEDQNHRFFSEFGMQAYPHVETARTFTKSENIFGPEMNNHQKNGGGNATIFHYISQLYHFPKDYQATVYLSQIMQAFTIRFGIEHMRRMMPRTMGAIYWQLNDCWPVASWSSIDFGGRWKALQYAAKRFFNPALVSVKLLGEEWVHKSTNHIFNEVSGVEIHTVYDGPKNVSGRLSWELWSISGNKPVAKGKKSVRLVSGRSVRQKVWKLEKEIAQHDVTDLVVRTRLEAPGQDDNWNTTFLSTPRRMAFPQPKIRTKVRSLAAQDAFEVEVAAERFAYQVYLNLDGAVPHRLSDNFIDLFPGSKRTLTLRTLRPMKVAEVRSALTAYSYRDSHLD